MNWLGTGPVHRCKFTFQGDLQKRNVFDPGSASRIQHGFGGLVLGELIKGEWERLELAPGEDLGDLPNVGAVATIGLADRGHGP